MLITYFYKIKSKINFTFINILQCTLGKVHVEVHLL